MSERITNPVKVFEKIFGTAEQIPWTQFVADTRKSVLRSKSCLRGFKRFLAEKGPDGTLIVKKEVFVKHLSSFPKIIVENFYAGGDIVNGAVSLTWIAKAFSVPGFFATKESQEQLLKNGQYCIRFTTNKDFVFSIEYKTPQGTATKLGLAIINENLFISKTEKAANLADLVQKTAALKGLQPMPYPENQRFLDLDEKKLYDKIQEDNKSWPKDKLLEEFENYVRHGIDTVAAYLEEKNEDQS
jgi:hypothetical protein